MAERRRLELHEEVEQVRESISNSSEESTTGGFIPVGDFRSGVLSTGSTLLDLAISGKRIREGGIPGGIIVEISGPAASGKTAVLAEVCSSAQMKGGQVRFLDPEARLDEEYSRIYGMELGAKDYFRPDLVSEVFSLIREWEPKNPDVINVIATDSLAALSTELEMDQGDKMGMKRAKEFSAGLRQTARIIRNNNWLIVCTNQVRQGEYGEVTPGGMGIPFYSSLRIRVGQKGKVEQKRKLSSGVEVKKVIGIESVCMVKKSTVDDPYREAPICIVFGLGIDDVRANLQWGKDMRKDSTYSCPDGKTYQSIDAAIRYVEESELVDQLREQTVEMWGEIEARFVSDRKPKIRF